MHTIHLNKTQRNLWHAFMGFRLFWKTNVNSLKYISTMHCVVEFSTEVASTSIFLIFSSSKWSICLHKILRCGWKCFDMLQCFAEVSDQRFYLNCIWQWCYIFSSTNTCGIWAMIQLCFVCCTLTVYCTLNICLITIWL